MKIVSSLFIVLTLFIATILIGCGQDSDEVISDASVENVEIYVSETAKEIPLLSGDGKIYRQKAFPVVAIVKLTFTDGCSSYHNTEYPLESSTGSIFLPIGRNNILGWQEGSIIEAKITKSDYVGPDACTDAVHSYEESIFIGLCFPGDYTLTVNDTKKMFTVGTFSEDLEVDTDM